MKIDADHWHSELAKHYEKDKSVSVSKDPEKFFDGFFCDGGFPISPEIFPIWWEKGIVISDESVRSFRFDLEHGQWREAELDDRFADYRLFWISDEGVFGEVSAENGRITEFFTISSPSQAIDFIGLIKDPKLAKPGKLAVKETPIESLIETLYIPFFRFPDDLTEDLNELPLVDASAIAGIISDHLDNSIPWLAPPLYELRRTKFLDRIKARPEEKATITMKTGDEEELITPSQFALNFFEDENVRFEPYRKKCFDAAARLTDNDILPVSDKAGLIRTGIQYAFAAGFFHMHLEVGIKLTSIVFPPFLSAWVNPKGFEAVTTRAVATLATDLKTKATQPGAISLPPLFDQKRIVFESLAFQHATRQKARQMDRFVHLAENRPDAFEQRALFENRHAEIDYMIKRLPATNNELARALRPLPFFLETPLLAWERAPEALRTLTGLSAFGNILRIMALLGLAELRLNSKVKLVPPTELAAAFASRGSSFGHWSKWLDWLHASRSQIPCFQGWISGMQALRPLAIELIELRNREVAHVSGPLSQDSLKSIEDKLARFFDGFGTSIRRTADLLRFYYPRNRQTLRKAAPSAGIRFRGLDLLCSHDRFREVAFDVPQSRADGLFEEELIVMCEKAHGAFSLNDYFRFAEIKPGLNDILIFEKGLDGARGLFTGIASGLQQKLPLDNDAFSFDQAQPD